MPIRGRCLVAMMFLLSVSEWAKDHDSGGRLKKVAQYAAVFDREDIERLLNLGLILGAQRTDILQNFLSFEKCYANIRVEVIRMDIEQKYGKWIPGWEGKYSVTREGEVGS